MKPTVNTNEVLQAAARQSNKTVVEALATAIPVGNPKAEAKLVASAGEKTVDAQPTAAQPATPKKTKKPAADNAAKNPSAAPQAPVNKTETKPVKEAKPVEKTKVNPKLIAARKIFDKNSTKPAGEIAGMIAKQMEITYSNAYYYVTRVFGKK